MIAQNIWGTLMTLANRIIETHTIFGMPVAFSPSEGQSSTGQGQYLSNNAKAEMVKMHQSILFCALIQYGLQGCRVQQQPTFDHGEQYSPTHVFPPGSEKAIYVTPKTSPAMPVSDSQQPVAATTPPTPSRPSQAATRKGAGPAKQRAKKGSVSSVCIPDVQRGDSGVLLNLEAGPQVPIAGLSKNQQKKLARQAKRGGPLKDNGHFAAALASGDIATATKDFEKHVEDLPKAPASAPAASSKTELRIPPPKPPKQLRQCKKIKDALEEGERRAANGEVDLPPTSGPSQSTAAQPAGLGTDPASNAFTAGAGKSNSSPAQPTFATNTGIAPPQITSAYAVSNSAPPQGSQGFQYTNMFQAQQQQNTQQAVDPQLFALEGQSLADPWDPGFEFDPLLQYDGQSHQPSGMGEQSNTARGDLQKENQQPAPASVNELLKASGLPAPTRQQCHGTTQQRPQPTPRMFTGTIAGVNIPPMDDTVNVPDNAVQVQTDTPANGPGVATNNVIESWNGMPVINNEVQTNGYGMQPLAAVMPPGTAPKSAYADLDDTNKATDGAQPDVDQDEEAFMRELFGEDFTEDLARANAEEDNLAKLTEADLIAVRMQHNPYEDAVEAGALAFADAFDKRHNPDNDMPQHDGSASPTPANKNHPANPSQDPAASKLFPVLPGIQQPQQQAPAPSTPSPTPRTPTAEQLAAREAYQAHQRRTAGDAAAQRARDTQRNLYLAVNRDLPSQAEREKRAKRKKAHERLAELRYITAEATVFPPGSAQRVGYEESIEEMGRVEDEIREMGDKVLTDCEYVVVRREGYRVEEHWIPEER